MKKLIILTLSWLFIGTACTEKHQEEQASLISPQTDTETISPATYHDQKANGKLFVIEREMPGAGSLTGEELQKASQKSNNVLRNLGPEITWVHSYVTGDKVYCVYRASDEDLIKKHAREAGFPANNISEAKTIISPATGE